ncbi:MAG: hypothetical protein A3G34_08505 [Candidatus Lindowbacteria bacterium RIFCSPLOWO2_12_FULL_62_27]|nr:MAG: hypothetical protein A3G34_08505 [Candidatus Lindowbacteria bacterium RIFCSPLOWO2_12_FULL_62_27]OGH62940.1 MAG: hypothetical protein A3I06_13750 [Candidatus Lindowbacteria bacterium RIFCSPLOWO2_02_FULL_62_12]
MVLIKGGWGAVRSGILPWVCLAALLCGCGTTNHVYVHPLADMTAAKKAVVLPFYNLAGNAKAPVIIKESLVVEILNSRIFDVVPESQIEAFLREKRIEAGRFLTGEEMKKIQEQFGADIIVYGTIQVYDEGKPEINVVSKIIDIESGVTIWTADIGVVGTSDLPTFGIGETTSMKRLVQKLTAKTVRAMFKRGRAARRGYGGDGGGK